MFITNFNNRLLLFPRPHRAVALQNELCCPSVCPSVLSRTSAKTAKVKCQGRKVTCPSDTCLPISQQQKVSEIPKLVVRLPTRQAIMRTRFEVKRSKVKVTRPINAETESVSPTNFKLGRRLVHALSTAMASYKGL